MSSHVEPLDLSVFERTYISQGLRRDGRKLEEYRSVVINVKSLTNADGSAIVRLGKTTVMCGIKAELAKPKPETPDEGYLVANIELQPLCSPEFSPGPPSDRAQLSSVFLNQTLKSTFAEEMKQLCIFRGKLVWVLYIDVICINEDGALLAAAFAAATAALQTLSLPKVHFDVETGKKTVDSTIREPLHINNLAFASQFAIFNNDKVLYDPTFEEESFSLGVADVVSSADPNGFHSFNINGSCPISSNLMEKCIAAAKLRANVLASMVDIASSSPER